MFKALGKFSANRRVLVLVGWIAIVIMAGIGAGRVETVLTGSFGEPSEGSSQTVRQALDEFPSQSPSSLTIVVNTSNSDLEYGDKKLNYYVDDLRTTLESRENVGDTLTALDDGIPRSQFVSKDGDTLLLFAGLDVATVDEAEELVPDVREALKQVDTPAGVALYVTGPPAVNYDIIKAGKEDAVRAEMIALPVTGIVLILAFRALVAAVIPLVIGALSVSVALAILYVAGAYFGMYLNVFSQTIATMLGLAVGIDYALLIVARFRESMREGFDKREAAVKSTMKAGRTVAFSGLTVALSFSALLISDSILLRSLGFTGIVTLFVAIAASLTAVPALLALVGERVDAPKALGRFLARSGGDGDAFWYRFARRVMQRPTLYVLAVLTLLVVASIPTLDMEANTPGVEVLPERSEARQGAELLEDMGQVGAVNPLNVLLDTGEAGGAFDREYVSALFTLTSELEEKDAISSVISPTSGPSNVSEGAYETLYSSEKAARTGPVAPLADMTTSEGGEKVLLTVIPEGLLTSGRTEALKETVREEVRARESLENTTITFGGRAQESLEQFTTVWDAFPRTIAIVLAASFALLVIAFRSLLMPLKAVTLNLLSVIASYGVLVAVFQYGWGANLMGVSELPDPPQLDFLVPVLLFAIIFGLSMDYEVFLISRIQEYHYAGHSIEESTAMGIGKTGPIITWAALIMVTVFVAFIVTPTLYMKEMGLPLAVAVLVDATLVRMALVPAFMKVAGRWNWWIPAWLERVLPKVRIEE